MTIKAIELNKKISTIFSDKKRDITIGTLKNTCLIGQGEKTCRYIMRNDSGYSCVKNSLIQVSIDNLMKKNSMTAKGNNCEGLVPKEEYDGNEKESKENKTFEANKKEESSNERNKEE